MISIADNLNNVRQSVKNAAISAARNEHDIKLLAVSKTKPLEDVEAAIAAGQKCFGENYLQDALPKIEALKSTPDLEWHFIGPIQSNKTRPIAEHFDWVQTIDRQKIAERLNEQRPTNLHPLNVCIQVNIDQEDAKAGVAIDEVMALAEVISSLPNLVLRGLMTIPAQQPDNELKQSFSQMRNLFNELKGRYPQVDTLSMGMSGDMPLAIAEGSTMVRVGTAIFGERTKNIKP